MKKMSFMLWGAEFCRSYPVIGKCIRLLLLNVFLPLYFFSLKKKHNVDFKVYYRHSVLGADYNPFLSDIDYSFVTKSVSKDLIKDAVAFSRKWKILDIPQYYLEDEFLSMPDIESTKNKWIRFFWYLRKFNWINQNSPITDYEIYKKERANKKIFSETLKHGDFSSPVNFSDLIFEIPKGHGPEVCLYSVYLGFVDTRRVLICQLEQFEFLISLLPGETPRKPLSSEWMDVKKSLWIHDFLLTRSHLRVHGTLEAPSDVWTGYLRNLETGYEILFQEKIVMAGAQYDFC
jgi:hypothetical protein